MPLPKYRVKVEPPGGFKDCPWLSVGGVYDGLEAPGLAHGATHRPIRLYTPGGVPHHYDLPPDAVEELPAGVPRGS